MSQNTNYLASGGISEHSFQSLSVGWKGWLRSPIVKKVGRSLSRQQHKNRDRAPLLPSHAISKLITTLMVFKLPHLQKGRVMITQLLGRQD